MVYMRFTLDRSTPSLWRVTFSHPPINLIDSVMIGELGELFAEVERNEGPAVLVFDSADPNYFLAHYDITAANRSRRLTTGRADGFAPLARHRGSAGQAAGDHDRSDPRARPRRRQRVRSRQ
jgi:enoyl-CoA hydratase/carnithine racemase